jgi:O-antigen ligase
MGAGGDQVLDGTVSVGRNVTTDGSGVVLPVPVLVLIATLAATVVAQGGYHLAGRMLSAALVGVALLAGLRDQRWAGATPVLLAASGLAVWAVARAAVNGAAETAGPVVLSVVCLVGALVVTQRADAAQRELCAQAVVGIGVLVALAGWIGVAGRIPGWTTVADGLVRAGSTVTYPNATAALLAALTVLAVSLRGSLPRAGGTYLLLVGLGSTLSRAGLLALLAGLVVLSVLAGPRPTARQLAAPGLGALVAIAALAPSIPVTASSRPVLAAFGLVAGLVITIGLTRLRDRMRLIAVLVGFALTVTAGVVVAGSSGTLHRLATSRITLSSPDRDGATHAALDLVAARPVTGVGPGRAWLSFTAPTGEQRAMRYVHNEYLQVLVELGLIGLVLLLCLLVAVALTVWRGRRDSTLWAGSVAGLTVLIVHSGFDFLWHLPAVLLTAGILTGLAGPTDARRQTPKVEGKS